MSQYEKNYHHTVWIACYGLSPSRWAFSITQDKGSALMSEYIDTLLSSENTFQVAWFSGEGWKRAISDGLIEIDAKIRQPSPSNPYGPYGPYNDEDYKDKDIAATYHFHQRVLGF